MLTALGATVGLALLAGLLWSRRLTSAAEDAYPATGDLVEVDGRRWHLIERGDGPPLVLLHGAFGGAVDFEGPVLDELATRYRVVVPDRPGHAWTERGTTPTGDDPDTPAEQAAELGRLMEHLGVERPLVLGFSWGGSVAAAWAVESGDDLAAVVTVNAATHPWPGWTSPAYTLPGVPLLGALLTRTLLGPLAQLRLADGSSKAFDPAPVPTTWSRSPVALAVTPPRYTHVAADMAALKAAVTELEPRYPEIDLPLVVVVGEGDLIAGPHVHSHPLATAVPGAELVSVEGGGHQLPYTHPHVLVDAVDRAYELAVSSGRVPPRSGRERK